MPLNLPRLRKVLLTKRKQENSLLKDQDAGGFQYMEGKEVHSGILEWKGYTRLPQGADWNRLLFDNSRNS